MCEEEGLYGYNVNASGRRCASTVFIMLVSGLDVYKRQEATLGGIKLSFIMSAIAALLACLIVVLACNYIFKNRNKKRGVIVEYCLLFPWLLPTILICYSYRTFFNSDTVWYVGNNNLYYADRVRLLIILAYTVVKLPFSIRMIKAAFYAIDEELEDAAKNLGASSVLTFLKVKLPIILPSVCLLYTSRCV